MILFAFDCVFLLLPLTISHIALPLVCAAFRLQSFLLRLCLSEFVVNFEAYDWIFKVTWNAAISLIPNAVFNLILTMEGIDDDSLPESALACFMLHPYGYSHGDDCE